jgi:hypothetical protein
LKKRVPQRDLKLQNKEAVKISEWNARADYAVLENRSHGEQAKRLYNVRSLRDDRKVPEKPSKGV